DLASTAAQTEYAPAEDEAYGGTDGWAPTPSLAAGGEDAGSDADVSGARDDGALEGLDVTAEADPEEIEALDAPAPDFDAFNRPLGFLAPAKDRVISEDELRQAAEDPGGSLELKRAARYVLDHPDLLERLARSRDDGGSGFSRGDIDLVRDVALSGSASDL